MENMNEKMMEHEMDMVDGIWMDENEGSWVIELTTSYHMGVSRVMGVPP